MNKRNRFHAIKTLFHLWLVFIFMAAIVLPAQAQAVKKKSCKVKVKELEGEYDGYCLKGLAQGEGIAKGEHMYTGEFKKGLPHGHGTYTYIEGSYYVGEFKEGLRHGKGKMYKLGEAPVYALWKNGEMLRELYEEEHKIVLFRNVTTVRCRVQDKRKNRIEFYLNGGANVEEVEIVSRSGQFFQDRRVFRLEDAIFPEKIRMTYKVWNKLMSDQNDVIIDIEFTSPGNWRVDIAH